MVGIGEHSLGDARVIPEWSSEPRFASADPLGNRLVVQPNGDVFVADNNEGVLPPGLFLVSAGKRASLRRLRRPPV